MEPADATSPGRILIVEDDGLIRRSFVAALTHGGHVAVAADDGDHALAILALDQFDLALVDMSMPGLSGIEFARLVRRDRRHDEMGIVFVSGETDLDSKLAALDAGATDYLVKPVALRELLARVDAHVRDRSSLHQRLQARFDTRSGLARQVIELDHTLKIDDLQDRLRTILSRQFTVRTLSLETSTAKGLSISQSGEETAIRMPLRRQASVLGTLKIVVPSAEADQAAANVTDLAPHIAVAAATALAQAADTHAVRDWLNSLAESGALQSVFQPIVVLATGEVVGHEVLTRFGDGTRPDRAFAWAAAHGAGLELEQITIARHLEGARHLPGDGWLSLNTSVSCIDGGDLAALLASTSRTLVLEVTENERVADYRHLRERISALPGVKLAVDDAGAGYASLRHVFELRPHFIKLDRSWVIDIDADVVRQSLVRGLVHFAASFDAKIIAEGIEDEDEASTFAALGVELAQGYLFGHPAPLP